MRRMTKIIRVTTQIAKNATQRSRIAPAPLTLCLRATLTKDAQITCSEAIEIQARNTTSHPTWLSEITPLISSSSSLCNDFITTSLICQQINKINNKIPLLIWGILYYSQSLLSQESQSPSQISTSPTFSPHAGHTSSSGSRESSKQIVSPQLGHFNS